METTKLQPETPVRSMRLLADVELVQRQLHCVMYLSKQVSELADAMAKMLPRMALDGDMGHHLIKMQGDWSHRYMEWVGDMMNGMDAVSPEDEKWDKTFADANARWKNLLDELNGKSANGRDQ